MYHNRSIAHIDLDTFLVSCERLQNSGLEDKPLIIGGGAARSVVTSCSYEVRRFGVRPGMPMRLAKHLCPSETVIIKGDFDQYAKYSALVTDILAEDAPVLEKASLDEFYIDVSGMDKHFGCYQWVQQQAQKVHAHSGLPLSFGLSINKTVAKIATGEGKPRGTLCVPQKEVTPFLNPLSVRKIPRIGRKTSQILTRIGIRKIQTLAAMPLEMVQEILGKSGTRLWYKAHGRDNDPVVPYQDKKSIQQEITFDHDTTHIETLMSALVQLVEQLSFKLRTKGQVCSVITVKIRYANFDTHTKQKRMSYTASDTILLRIAKDLFQAVHHRRMRIRLIGVRFSGLAQGHTQIDLFTDTGKDLALHQALDKVRNRFGLQAVMRANNLPDNVS